MKAVFVVLLCFSLVSFSQGFLCYFNSTGSYTTWFTNNTVGQYFSAVPANTLFLASIFRNDSSFLSGTFYVIPGRSVNTPSAIFSSPFSTTNTNIVVQGNVSLVSGNPYTLVWVRSQVGINPVYIQYTTNYLAGEAYLSSTFINSTDLAGQFCFENNTCSGPQDCGNRGICIAPGICACNTTLWTGNTTGCNTPVCNYGFPICNGGTCFAPGICNCSGTFYNSTCPPSPSASPSRTPSPAPNSTISPSPPPFNVSSPSPSSSPASPSGCSQCSNDLDCSLGRGICVNSSIGRYCSCLSGFGGCNCNELPSIFCNASYSQVDDLSANFNANTTIDYNYPMLFVTVDANSEESVWGNGGSTPTNTPPYSQETLVYFGPSATSFPFCSYPNGGLTWIDFSSQPGRCYDKYLSNMTWSYAMGTCGFAAVNGSRNYTQTITIQRKYNLDGGLQRTEQTTRNLYVVFPTEVPVQDSDVTVSFPSASVFAAITFIDYDPSALLWTVIVQTSISSPYFLGAGSLLFLTGNLVARPPSVSVSDCATVGSSCIQTLTYVFPQGFLPDACLGLVGLDRHTFPVYCSASSCPASSNINITLQLNTGNACPSTDIIDFSETSLTSYSDASLSSPSNSFTTEDAVYFGASVQTTEALISSRTLVPGSVCFQPPSGPCYHVNYTLLSPTNGKEPVFMVNLQAPGNIGYFSNTTTSTQYSVSAVVQVNFVGAKGLMKNVPQSQTVQTITQAVIQPGGDATMSASNLVAPLSIYTLIVVMLMA